MLRVDHPRLTAAVVSLGAGLLVLATGPALDVVKRADRAVFGFLSGKSGELVGNGSVEDPWGVETLGPPPAIEPPRVFYLDDNPDQYFERMPPPPSDLMVVMARLEAAGLDHVGFGYPLQWESPDTLAIETMRRAMDRFDRAVIGYVVKDSTAPEPVVPPFLRASMPYGEVDGDGTKLPVVNSIRGIAPEFGGKESWAGFTRIETEEGEANRAYLLARWSDRVVFSLPLALEIARLGLSPEEDVRVRMGKDIRLGSDGPRIPIDFRGRVDLPDGPIEREAVPATTVISDEIPEGFLDADAPVFFTDERLLGDKADRQWAERMPRVDAAVRGAPRTVGKSAVSRPSQMAELFGILGLSLIGASLLGKGGLLKRLGLSVVLIGLVAGALAICIRSGVAPMPLAFLTVPVATAFSVLLFDTESRVEVVRAKAAKKAPAEPKAAKKAKRRKGKRRP
ncbi:hypothetical protein HAHE_10900 [Haloferula helveola]|uniref:CHASE2 domain-containing protein n=1 Tax=Haloferula helveola TaxID=490095 RepID=A0ABN6H3J4_9BACT|nr:hypothetical protein HAHE_10900 [Haloferula helveola]